MFLIFNLPLKLRLVYIRNKETVTKLRVVHIRKKFKISNFSKMALTILIKFCGFIEHSKLNNMALYYFPEKFLIKKYFLYIAWGVIRIKKVFCSLNLTGIINCWYRNLHWNQSSRSRVITKETSNRIEWQTSGILQT